MNKFVARMLELGAELDKAVSPIEISMVINDAEILYKNHIEQLTIPDVVSGFFCEDENLESYSIKCKEQCDGCKWVDNFFKNKTNGSKSSTSF